MKRFFIVCLSSLLLQSCFSLYPPQKNERGEAETIEGKAIRIILNDGSMIDCERSDHFEIETPADFIYGIGEQYDEARGRTKNFRGRILQSFIDSVMVVRDSTDEIKNGMLVIWCKNGEMIRFKKNNYINVSREQGTGIYCIGKKIARDTESRFAGKVDRKDIKEILLRSIDVSKTTNIILSVSLGVAAIMAFVLLAAIGGLKP